MDITPLARHVWRFAERRHGIVSRAALIDKLGVPDWWIDKRLRDGLLISVHRSVYRLAGVQHDLRSRMVAATEWAAPDGVVALRSCAWLFGLGPATDSIYILGERTRNDAPPNIVYRRTSLLPKCDRTKVGIIPSTTVTRMLIDIGRLLPEPDLEAMLDKALYERRTSIEKLNARLHDLAKPGRPGVAAIRKLLRDRDPALAPNESELETRCSRLFRRAGLPKVTPQWIVYDEGGYVGRLDFDYPDDDLVIEAHSYKYHSSPAAFQRDTDRWNRLRAMGKRVVLITWRDVVEHPESVIADIERELRRPRGLFRHG